MNSDPKNLVASISARLANKAKQLDVPFGDILQYYGMERFLYRLLQTPHSSYFILKGGLLFYSWGIPLRRSTRDIDFFGFAAKQKEEIERVIGDSIRVLVPDDGVIFDLQTLVVEIIQAESDRQGIRASFKGYLGKARINMQTDFGFSDEITSEPVLMHYPVLLAGMEEPQIKIYPVVSVIAEKFHAMQHHADLPSRWKDWYDLWLISESFEFDEYELQKAIAKTFENRHMSLPVGRPVSLTVDFAMKNQKAWSAFLKKSNLENTDINDLVLLVEKIWIFLEQPLQGLASQGMHDKPLCWLSGERKWI